jgi:TetR/AcrR family transcriptional repressor of nem operon
MALDLNYLITPLLKTPRDQRGFDGGSMADLMEAAGLERGGIYRHFSTKEELAAEAFDYAWQAATHVGMHDLDSNPNSVDKLKAIHLEFH